MEKREIKKIAFVFLVGAFILALASLVSSQEVKFCCEKTTYGAWCQNAPASECDNAFSKTPTSCEATSYCKLGCCYDYNEGICMESTTERACRAGNGTWADSQQCEIPQCQMGCCVLGTQAAFVTLTRCKKLSSFYGLQTDFRQNIQDELSCVSLASLSDRGACVYEADYGSKSCKQITRQECNAIKSGMTIGNETVTGNISFYKDYLCSAEDLGTICGASQQTTCIDGKDEVYFMDTCGNPANIYDASKFNDKSYWRKIIPKEESCNSKGNSANSLSCGNCNYFGGSICKDYKVAKSSKPTYGNLVCSDLNCKTTTLGKAMKHGESWCSTDKYEDSVGSRYFRHICVNGEELLEPCADFRQEICIQDSVSTTAGEFLQAGCRVNRWQECYNISEQIDCENIDKRDCKWIGGDSRIKCIPLHTPGFKFWDETAKTICSQANAQCEVSYVTKGLLTSSTSCQSGCECEKDSWKEKNLQICEALGDCGASTNWLGALGFKEGYKITTKKAKSEDKK